MRNHHRFLDKKLYALFLITLSITATSGFGAALELENKTATELDLNTTLRGWADGDGKPELFRLELPAPGIATVDLVTTGADHVPAKLEPRLPADVTVLEQSATHLAFAALAPGTLFLRAGAEDPTLPLRGFKLATSFVEARVVKESFTLAPAVSVNRTSFHAAGVASKGDQEDVDPDPGSLILPGGGRLLASFTTFRFSSSVAVKSDQEDVDPDPGSLILPGGGRDVADEAVFYEVTCRNRDEVDDHGDTMACATPLGLGDAVAGEIGNAHGDDVDVFELSLTALTTVELSTRGDADTFGVLSDRSGQRLAVDDDGAGGHDFRIIATLAPGRYYVRVGGSGGAEGAYELKVAVPGG